jgi:hypothetical protein
MNTEKAVQTGKAALQGWFGPLTVFPVGNGPKRHYEAEGWIHVGPASLWKAGPFYLVSLSPIAGG